MKENCPITLKRTLGKSCIFLKSLKDVQEQILKLIENDEGQGDGHEGY